jgi:glycosyltransferase involved in cell wall biosynthesis
VADPHAEARDFPEVSVVMITFNHADYIEDAVESVFAQHYSGVIRLIVCDDCSTDDTPRKLHELKSRSPIPLTLVLRDVNVGGLANLRDAWSRATGAYLAFLEGDDYWASPNKLALQIAALEARPRATMAFGKANVLDETVTPPAWHPPTLKAVATPTLADLLEENFVYTPTVVYRRGVVPVLPSWFDDCAFRDWPLHVLHAAQGEVIYHDEVLATWRLHHGGRWTATDYAQRMVGTVEVRERIWNEVGPPNELTMRRLRANDFAILAACTSDRSEAIALLRRALRLRLAVARQGMFLYALARLGLGDVRARRILSEVSRRRGEPRGLAPR